MPSLVSFLRGLVSQVRETFEKVVRTFTIPEEFVQVPTAVSAVVDAAIFEARETIDTTITFKTCYIERLGYDGEDLSFVPSGDWQWGGRVVAVTPDGQIIYVDRRLPRGEAYDEWKIVSLAIEELGGKMYPGKRFTSKMVRDYVIEVIPFQERIVRTR